jgi:hypothetical protein
MGNQYRQTYDHFRKLRPYLVLFAEAYGRKEQHWHFPDGNLSTHLVNLSFAAKTWLNNCEIPSWSEGLTEHQALYLRYFCTHTVFQIALTPEASLPGATPRRGITVRNRTRYPEGIIPTEGRFEFSTNPSATLATKVSASAALKPSQVNQLNWLKLTSDETHLRLLDCACQLIAGEILPFVCASGEPSTVHHDLLSDYGLAFVKTGATLYEIR